MNTILVPLDGSELSALALPYAGMVGKLLGADLRLLHVVTEGDRQDFVIERERIAKIDTAEGRISPSAPEALSEHAERYLAGEAERLRAEGVRVQFEVAVGEVAQAIVDAAERCEASMIAMATHGRGSIGRLLVGSVAHKVMRLTSLPVLAIRGPAPEQPALRRIMVPLDGSTLAREALPMALDLARRSGATLILVTVLAPQVELDPSLRPPPGASAMEALREQLFHELDTLVADCRDVQITTVIGEGMAADTICREAERHAVDLIVMTSHGHSGLRHFAMGSVTDKVLHSTQVPVLIVHAGTAAAKHAESDQPVGAAR